MSVVVITGASSGLGAALAGQYAAPGTTLGLLGRDQARLQSVADQCAAQGAEVICERLDVADTPSMQAFLTAFDARRPIDVLIANAGVSAGPPHPRALDGLEAARLQVSANLVGVINTIEPVAPHMLARGRGRIGVVASIAGLRGLPYSPAYSASKAGARAYGESLRALMGPHGVTVTVVCPGFFRSPMTDRWRGPKPFLSDAEPIARRVKRAVDAGRPRLYQPWPLVLGLRAAELGPPQWMDMAVRAFQFRISPP